MAAIGHPYRTETAVLRTPGYGLNRGKHILCRVKDVPPGLEQSFTGHAATDVLPLQIVVQGVSDRLTPYEVSVSGDDRIGSHLERFVGEDRGVNASHNHRRALRFRFPQDSVTRLAIARSDSYSDDISRMDGIWVEPFKGFIDHRGITNKISRRGLGNYKKPPWRDNAISPGRVCRIHQYHPGHFSSPQSARAGTVGWIRLAIRCKILMVFGPSRF